MGGAASRRRVNATPRRAPDLRHGRNASSDEGMRDMSNLVSKLTIAALLAGAASLAHAAPGNGIRLGGSEGRLHPFVELEGRYDSNVYVGATSNAEAGDVIIHVRPGLSLVVPGDMTSVELTAKLDIAQYLGNSDTATKDLSKLYAEAELGVSVNKKGVVALEVNDAFRRSDRPEALSLNTGVISNFNLFEAKLPIRPGGGALTLNLNGAWALETYESLFKGGFTCDPAVGGAACDPALLSKLGYSEVRGGAGVAWKFLPRTSALLEGSYFKRLPNDTTLAADPAGYRISAGVSGLVTPHVAATVKAGYGSTTGVTPSLGTWLAAVEGEWMPSETTSVKLGYSHDLAVDPVALYATNRVSLSARQLVAGRVALGLTGSWDQLAYSPGSETTTILRASPSVGVDVTRWLKAELAYAYTDRSSSTGAVAVVRDYTKSEVWLKAVATY